MLFFSRWSPRLFVSLRMWTLFFLMLWKPLMGYKWVGYKWVCVLGMNLMCICKSYATRTVSWITKQEEFVQNQYLMHLSAFSRKSYSYSSRMTSDKAMGFFIHCAVCLGPPIFLALCSPIAAPGSQTLLYCCLQKIQSPIAAPTSPTLLYYCLQNCMLWYSKWVFAQTLIEFSRTELSRLYDSERIVWRYEWQPRKFDGWGSEPWSILESSWRSPK